MVPSPAKLDFSTATASVAELDRALRTGGGQGGAPGVDLSTLSHFDSSALAVLLELRRRFHGVTPFAAVNPPAPLHELAEVYGVAELLFGSSAAARQ